MFRDYKLLPRLLHKPYQAYSQINKESTSSASFNKIKETSMPSFFQDQEASISPIYPVPTPEASPVHEIVTSTPLADIQQPTVKIQGKVYQTFKGYVTVKKLPLQNQEKTSANWNHQNSSNLLLNKLPDTSLKIKNRQSPAMIIDSLTKKAIKVSRETDGHPAKKHRNDENSGRSGPFFIDLTEDTIDVNAFLNLDA